jgi:hypothetical protein
VLDPALAERVPATAKKVRGKVEMVLDSATALGLRTGPNPAAWRGHLQGAMAAISCLPSGKLSSNRARALATLPLERGGGREGPEMIAKKPSHPVKNGPEGR